MALALLAGLATASGPLPVSSVSPVGAHAPEPYDLASSADRKLLNYDRAHPDCDLWTNWRKLCSRMGPNGETTCRTDLYHSAKPSEPFCADSKPGRQDTPAEALSRNRYCAEFSVDGPRRCRFYQADRPFNGTRIAQLETPDCLRWTSLAGACATNASDAEGLPLCSTVSIREPKQIAPYSCTKWSPGIQCAHPVGGDEPDRDNGIDMLMGPTSMQFVRPVWGVYCLTRGVR
jgi:hypothetical protein